MNVRKWLTIAALLVLWVAFVRIYNKQLGGGGGSLGAPLMEPVGFPRKMATGFSLKDSSDKLFDWSTTKGTRWPRYSP